MLPVGTPNGSTAIVRRKRMAHTNRTALSTSRRREVAGSVFVGSSVCWMTGASPRTAGPLTIRASGGSSETAGSKLGARISSMRRVSCLVPRVSSPSTAVSPSIVGLQHGQERFLRDLDLPDLFHALLAGSLFRPMPALAGDVAAVALGRHVLADGRDRFASDDSRPDRCLQGD